MFVKYLTAGLAGTVLLTTAAFAQTPTATGDRATAPMATSDTASSDVSFHSDWRTSKVVGLSVYNDANESVGSINDLLTDKSGNIKAAIISVGGVLGVGAHLVAVPFDKIKFSNEAIAYTGVAGAPNGTGTPPASNMTTGAATTGSATNNSAAVAASKPNPWYPDHAVFNATKDQLKSMPEFKYATE